MNKLALTLVLVALIVASSMISTATAAPALLNSLTPTDATATKKVNFATNENIYASFGWLTGTPPAQVTVYVVDYFPMEGQKLVDVSSDGANYVTVTGAMLVNVWPANTAVGIFFRH